jgi:hypothetical protein
VFLPGKNPMFTMFTIGVISLDPWLMGSIITHIGKNKWKKCLLALIYRQQLGNKLAQMDTTLAQKPMHVFIAN